MPFRHPKTQPIRNRAGLMERCHTHSTHPPFTFARRRQRLLHIGPTPTAVPAISLAFPWQDHASRPDPLPRQRVAIRRVRKARRPGRPCNRLGASSGRHPFRLRRMKSARKPPPPREGPLLKIFPKRSRTSQSETCPRLAQSPWSFEERIRVNSGKSTVYLL